MRGRTMNHTGNLLFVLAAGAGAWIISGVYPVSDLFLLISTPSIVLIYAGITALDVKKQTDRELMQHRIESVYFLGFFMTLLSILVLFLSISRNPDLVLSSGEIGEVFLYIGVSVGTTMSGILGRNILLGSLISASGADPEDSMEALERSYALLKEIAQGFDRNYSRTVEQIDEFLKERRERDKDLTMAEKRYTENLHTLNTGLEHIGLRLGESDALLKDAEKRMSDSLSRYSGRVEEIGEAEKALIRYGTQIHSQLESLPFDTIRSQVLEFSRDSGELSKAVESIIDILDSKIEKVKL